MSEYLYDLKPSLITQTEKPYLTAIKKALPRGYFVQPQVNLASIIRKNGEHRFQNELYRNIDACVFDMTYKPILLIEINDNTHNERNRRERDEKIKNICEDAGIQLITLWTNYGVDEDYIYRRINSAIQNVPTYKRKAHFTQETQHSLSDERIDELLDKYQNADNNSVPEPTYKKPDKSFGDFTRVAGILIGAVLCYMVLHMLGVLP